MKPTKTNQIKSQLMDLGVNTSLWCTQEIHELQSLLIEGEKIAGLVKGWYAGGFAILLATTYRILLVDKKPLYLGVEDIRYEMVCQVDYGWQILKSDLLICTVNKQLKFSGFDKRGLRALTTYIQKRIMQLRQYHAPDLLVDEAGNDIGSADHKHVILDKVLKSVGSAATWAGTNAYTNNSLLSSKHFTS